MIVELSWTIKGVLWELRPLGERPSWGSFQGILARIFGVLEKTTVNSERLGQQI